MSPSLVAVAVLAACGPRRPEGLDLYQHPPPRAAAELFPPPPSLAREDVLAPVDDSDAALGALLPREPVVVNPGRPLAGGEALRLADLAMTRGDALDAASQYQRLLGDRRSEVATYVRWRLALAYLQLGREDEAEAALREVAGASSPVEWAALCALADLLEARAGAPEAMRALGARAGRRADELEVRMLRRGRGPGRVALLVARAARATQPDDGCALALAALALDHRVVGDATVRRCYDDLRQGRLAARAPAVAAASGQLHLGRTQLALVDDADHAWRTLDVREVERLDGTRWVGIASSYAFAFAIDEASPAGEVAAWCAVAALENARRTTEARRDPDPALADRVRLASDRLRDLHGGGTISICSASRAEILARAP